MIDLRTFCKNIFHKPYFPYFSYITLKNFSKDSKSKENVQKIAFDKWNKLTVIEFL